jgi:hypothetical protein
MRNKSVYPLLVPVSILYSQPLFRFFSKVVITPQPFSTVGILEGSKEVEISGSKIWAPMVDGEEQPIFGL